MYLPCEMTIENRACEGETIDGFTLGVMIDSIRLLLCGDVIFHRIEQKNNTNLTSNIFEDEVVVYRYCV